MKKKVLNIAVGTLLGAAFLGTVAFAVREYHTEREKETEKEIKVKVPEALTPHQIGEEALYFCAGVNWDTFCREVVEVKLKKRVK